MAHFDAGRFAGLRATAVASFELWGLNFDYFEAVMTAVDVENIIKPFYCGEFWVAIN